MSMVINWIFYRLTSFKTSAVMCNGKRIKVFVADNFARQLVGLMYRESLKPDEGMLFVFGRESRWGIWMMDMRFSIDIVWMDRDGKVVNIKKDAQPCKSVLDCETHRPSKDSRYVLELAAGGVSRYRIKVGDSIRMGAARA